MFDTSVRGRANIRRLAEANAWNDREMSDYGRFGAHTVPDLTARLAAISGTAPETLRHAMLELRTPGGLAAMTVAGRTGPGLRQRTGCRRCIRGRPRNSGPATRTNSSACDTACCSATPSAT